MHLIEDFKSLWEWKIALAEAKVSVKLAVCARL